MTLVLLTIDGGPLFSGPDACTPGHDSLGRKRCAVPENRQGEIAGRSTPWSSVGKFREAKVEPGKGLTAGQRCLARWARVSRPSTAGGAGMEA